MATAMKASKFELCYGSNEKHSSCLATYKGSEVWDLILLVVERMNNRPREEGEHHHRGEWELKFINYGDNLLDVSVYIVVHISVDGAVDLLFLVDIISALSPSEYCWWGCKQEFTQMSSMFNRTKSRNLWF